ncbi:MAG: hypothetical protein EP332_00200 [Bacteroidetes bacterium]|nr:MAG: hypothetical protein EP332_00200 [Bacteroidota bacterium]
MNNRRGCLVIMLCALPFLGKGQLLNSFKWTRDTVDVRWTSVVSEIRQGTIWYGKSTYNQKSFDLRLELLDTSRFIFSRKYYNSNERESVTVGIITSSQDMIFDGTSVIIGHNGDTLCYSNYSGGQRTGVYHCIFMENHDTFQIQGHFSRGLFEGPYQLYINGRLRAKGNYENASKTGTWTYYSNNGVIMAQGSYCKERYLDSFLRKSLVFENAYYEKFQRQCRKGKWRIYDKKGELSRTEFYKKGFLTRVKFKSELRGIPQEEDYSYLEVMTQYVY